MNGQWDDQNRMLHAAGPVLLTTLGVLLLVVTALVFYAGPPAPSVLVILLVTGVTGLVAGLAWGARSGSAPVREP